jgi:hypothetical protein
MRSLVKARSGLIAALASAATSSETPCWTTTNGISFKAA